MIKVHSIFKNVVALALVLALGIGAITAPAGINTVNAATASPAFAKTTYKVGKGYQVTLKINDVGKKTTTWQLSKSAKELVTIVSKTNTSIVLKGKKVGKAVINAKVSGKAIKTTLEVKKTYVYLSKSSISMTAGDTAELKLNGTKSGSWSVTNSNILSLTKESATKVKVKGKKAGTATVKAKVDGKTYECKVTVKKAPSVKPQNTGDKKEAKLLDGREYIEYKGTKFGTGYVINLQKGDISVKIKPVLVNTSLEKEYREYFDVPDSVKLYDQIEVSFTNNLNINNVMVPAEVHAFGTKYGCIVYSDGSTRKQIREKSQAFYTLQNSDLDKEGSWDYINLKKGQTKTYRMIPYRSGVKFMSYADGEPIQVNIRSFENNANIGISYLYFPATGKSTVTYMKQFKDNGYDCTYWPE